MALAMFFSFYTFSLAAQSCEPALFYFPGDNYTGDFHIDRTVEGNYLLAGEIDNSAAGSGKNIHILKADDFGNEIWSTTLVWPGDESVSAVRTLPDGSAVIVGSTDSENIANATQSIFLVKIREDGNTQWWRTYGQYSSWTYTGTDVEILPAGGFVISGNSRSANNYEDKMVFLTTDPNGQQTQWKTLSLFVEDMNGNLDFGRSSTNNVTILENGDFVFTGITYPQSFAWPTGGYFTVVRTSPSLTTVWELASPFGFCLLSHGWALLEEENGDLNIAVSREPQGCFDVGSSSSMHRVSGAGEYLGTSYLGESGGRSIIRAEDGNMIIGRARSIAKVDTYGEILWESPSMGSFTSGAGNSLVASNNGGYILSGRQQGAVVLIEFDSLGNTCTNSLSGKVYFDTNQNCTFDSSEVIVPNVVTALNNGVQFANTNPEGWYHYQLDTGQYMIQMAPPNNLWSIGCPLTTAYNLDLVSVYHNYDDLDFSLHAVESCALLSVEGSLGWARACREQTIAIQYNNLGTQAAEGVYVTLDFDETLTFIDASVPWQQIDGEYRFFVGELGIMEYGRFNVQVEVACDAELGTQACFRSAIFPVNNCSMEEGHPMEEQCSTIRNSYDPNDKLVVAADTASCWKTALDKLEFTVRFQNTGNDTAFQVVILDTLPDYLDMESVQPGPGSHDYNLRVLGENQLMFAFSDINLLDSTNHEAESHGFVQFSVYPKATIADGTVISNRAAIYFDHNPPIFTPTVSIDQCIVVPLTIVEVEAEEVTDCTNPNGILNVIAAGGAGNYEYSIDGGEHWQTEEVFLNLIPGDYEVLLRDVEGQEYNYPENPVTVTEALPILLSLSPYSPTSCGGENGRITIDAVAPGALMYSVDGGENFQADPAFLSLTEGTYTVLVLNECLVGDTIEVVLTDPTPPVITDVTWQTPNCEGNGGQILVEADGVRPLRFSVDDGESWRTYGIFNGLQAGVYQVVVSYGAGNCEVMYESEIELFAGSAPPEIVTVEANNGTDCDGGDGIINVFTISEEGMEYSIDGGETFQGSSMFTGLSAGWYDIIVRNECDTRDTFPAVEVASLAVPELTDFEIVRPGCGAENGSINILGGEAASLLYSIDDWETDQEEPLFTNLSGGMYTVVVSNEYGCTTSLETIALEEVAAPVIQNVNETNPGCTDSASGEITIVANSEESLLYSIDGGANWFTEATFTNLTEGAYEVMVSNENLTCIETSVENPVQLTPPIFPVINDIEIIHPSTGTASDGSITIAASGEAYLYFSINEGQDWQGLNVFSNLPAGEYTIWVRSGGPDCIVSESDIVLDATVAVGEEKMQPILAVYPNPTSNKTTIRVELPVVEEIEVSLVSVLGNTLRHYPKQKTSLLVEEIQIASLPAGIYYLQFVIGGELFQKALVVI
jgi:hypothetical protein